MYISDCDKNIILPIVAENCHTQCASDLARAMTQFLSSVLLNIQNILGFNGV